MIASTALCGGRPHRRRSVRRIKFQHRFQQRKSRVALFQLWVSVPSIHRSARTARLLQRYQQQIPLRAANSGCGMVVLTWAQGPAARAGQYLRASADSLALSDLTLVRLRPARASR